jgi:hypothetical protein
MARRYHKKHSGHKSRKIPLLATAGVAAYALNIYNDRGNGVNGFKWQALGIDNSGKFEGAKFIQVMTPPLIGILGSAAASKFKLNRYISGIPVFKF